MGRWARDWWRREPTPAMLADDRLGACLRDRPGCITLGPWRPFYQGYVCDYCLQADADDLTRSEGRAWPFTHGGGLWWPPESDGGEAMEITPDRPPQGG